MASLVRGDLDAMMRLRVGLVQSSSKYVSEASLLRRAAESLEQASETNAHEAVADIAREAAARLDTISAAFDAIADNLTPEIERLATLEELTRRA